MKLERDWNSVEHIHQLKTGDIVRNKGSGNAYVVTGQYGGRATAVTSVDITHANEWEVLDQSPLRTKSEPT